MKGLFYNGQEASFRDDLPMPQPQAGESLIRITLAAICNTDREVMKGYKPDFTGVMGHEFVGVVEQSDDSALVGRRVVGELNAGCGQCVYCRTGRERHCTQRKVIGLSHKDGCFAQYMTLSNHLIHPVPDAVTDEAAIYTEPLAAALEIPQMTHIPPNEEVCVIGDGRLAFMIAQVLALNGAGVTVVGHNEDKLKMFASFANTTLKPDRTFELVVDACGSPTGIDSAAALVRHGGTIILKSTYAGVKEMNLSSFVVNEVTLRGSRCGPFAPALRLLKRGLIQLPSIQLFAIEDWQDAFASRAFKAGFDFRDL
ncbi:MAG: alcohol dehydrogenase catalytic domain-containing protein [Angelakisella sp.]|nr:alcohol dehydrogenase catalytic domain-containing protein [Angelakisella sp.]